MYKQRLFSININKLLSELEKAKDEGPILLALSHLIQNVPKVVLLNEVKRLFPLVLRALQSSNASLVEAALRTLHTLLSNAQPKMEEQLQTIIPILLNLVKFNTMVNLSIKLILFRMSVSLHLDA